MAELRQLWSAAVLGSLHDVSEDEVVLVDPAQRSIVSKDVGSGLTRAFNITSPYIALGGPPILAVSVVTDSLQQKHVSVLHAHGFAERWSMGAAQLEATCSWKSKTAAEVGAVSKRPGDMIGFLATHSPSTPLQCVRLDTGAVSQSRLDLGPAKAKGQIVQLLCHPKYPWLAISYSKGTVQIWDYSALLTKDPAADGTGASGAAEPMGGYSGGGGPGAGGGAGGDGGTDMMSEEQDVQVLSTAQLTLVGVIQSPISGDGAPTTCVQFHPSENLMLCVFGGVVMSTYDLTPLAAGVSEEFATGSLRSGTGKDRDLKSAVQKLEPIAAAASLPRNWSIVSATFDTNCPIAYTAVQRQPEHAKAQPCLVVAHTLLEPSLRICATVALRGLDCVSLTASSTGQLLCLCQESRSGGRMTGVLQLHAVDVLHANESAWGNAVVCARSPLPPDAFTQPGRLPRFAFYVRQTAAISTSGLRPLFLTASVFRHRIGSSSLRKGTQKPELCFEIPSTVSNQSKAQTIQIEGTLRDGPFLPTRVKATVDGSCFCIVGAVVAPVATEEHRTSVSACLHGLSEAEVGNHELIGAFPAVAIAFAPTAAAEANAQQQASGAAIHPQFIPARDAIFWVAPTGPASAENMKGETLLCLSQDGTKVVWLSRTGELLSSWVPKLPLLRLFGHSMQGNRPALLVSLRRREFEFLCVSASPEIQQHLSRWFQCRAHERILDAQWQPLPSVYQQAEAPQEELDAQRPWIAHRSGALLAALTSQRVLILDPELELLTELEYASGPGRVQSIFWLGLAVLLVRDNGTVEYLLPAHLPSAVVRIDESQPCSSPFKATLCSLPTNRAFDIVSCLPDRLVYFSQLPQRHVGVAVLNRPCVSVEPLALGLIASARPLGGRGSISHSSSTGANGTHVSDPHASQRANILKSLVLSYYYPRQAFGVAARTDNGAHPTTHATERLTRLLLQAGHADLASVLVGLQTSTHEFGQTYEARAWLQRETRFDVALALKRYDEGVLETLAADPGLQELYIEPESLGGGGLPHPRARLAKGLRHMSRVLASTGATDVASKLADMAGDDVMLASYLLCQQGTGSLKDVQRLASSNQARNPHLASFLEALASPPTAAAAGTSEPSSPPPISSNDAGGSARRTALLHVSTQIDRREVVPQPFSETVDVVTLHREHESLFAQTGLRLGPQNKALDVLAADSVEDYMGRTVMECVELEASSSPLGQSGQRPQEATFASEPADSAFGVDRSAWVEGVGKGRGEDRVVGYWRFGDIAKPGTEGFVSTCEPAARANLPDISRFGNSAELVSEGARVSVAQSQSPVDQGENSVKNAYDVIFNNTPLDAAAGVSVALRCSVKRGSSLDVGFFHDESNRSRLTFEMWIRRDDDMLLSDGAPHILAARVIPAQSTRFATTALWSLSVDANGHLVFAVGGALPGCDASSALPREELKSTNASVAVGMWTHVAVVVDTSLSEYVPFTPGKPHEPQRAAVTLFVNAEREGAATMQVPAVPETQLDQTLLYLGYNLRSWKFTEVRIWATLRSDLDLADAKDNYLQLASTHKRLTIKMTASSRSSSTFSIGSTSSLEVPAPAAAGSAATPSQPTAARLTLPRGSLSVGPSLMSAPGDSTRPSRRAKSRKSVGSESASFSAFSSTPGLASPPAPTKGLEPVSEGADQEESDALPLPDHPPPPPPAKRRSEPAAVTGGGAEGVRRLGQLADAQVELVDVLRDIRSSLFSSSPAFAVSIVGKSEDLNGLCVMEASTTASNTLTFTRYKIQAESVIVSPIQTSKVVAMYARGVLAVFDITTKRKVAEQKLAAPLVFWAWLDAQSIVLVLSNAVYKWTIAFEEGATTAPPVKLFERADIDRTDPNQWSQRRVLQFGQSQDERWACVLSSERNRPEHPVDQTELIRTSRVSLHNLAEGGEVKTLDAVAAAFSSLDDGACAVVLVKQSASGGGFLVSVQALTDPVVLAEDAAWENAMRWTRELPVHAAADTPNPAHLSPGAWVCVVSSIVVVLLFDGTVHQLHLSSGEPVQPAMMLTSEGVISAALRVDNTVGKPCVFALGRQSGSVFCLPVV